MLDLHLDRSFHQHTQGPYKGMTVVEYWYSYEPLARYRTCFSSKVWDSMTPAARDASNLSTRIKAAEALAEMEDKRNRATNGAEHA